MKGQMKRNYSAFIVSIILAVAVLYSPGATYAYECGTVCTGYMGVESCVVQCTGFNFQEADSDRSMWWMWQTGGPFVVQLDPIPVPGGGGGPVIGANPCCRQSCNQQVEESIQNCKDGCRIYCDVRCQRLLVCEYECEEKRGDLSRQLGCDFCSYSNCG